MNTFLLVVLAFSSIHCLRADELQVHNLPDYLSSASTDKNENANRFTVSNFANSFLTLLGFSADKEDKQTGSIFYSTQPLQIPASVWLFHVEGLGHLSNTGLPLISNGDFDINSLQSKLSEFGQDDALSIGTMLIASEADLRTIPESLNSLISQTNSGTPIKYIVIICDECKSDQAVQSLEQHLTTTIKKIVAENPQALVMTLVTEETARVRRARSLTETKNVTIATMYSDEYPTMFNLFFWTSLALVLILISIVYVFLTLDPGSDSIIYRMTAPRLKTD